MNVLDQFFANVTNEFGEKINFSNIESEGFTGIVCFEDRSAEISIDTDSYNEYESDLNDNDQMMLNAFIEYTQSEMRKLNFFIQNTNSNRWTHF